VREIFSWHIELIFSAYEAPEIYRGCTCGTLPGKTKAAPIETASAIYHFPVRLRIPGGDVTGSAEISFISFSESLP
jgi:hypothetical protein